MKKNLLKITYPNFLISIVIIFSLIAQTLPLVKILNFEFSFLFSIILFIVSGVLTIHYLRKFKTFGVLPAIIRMKYKRYLLLLFAPLLISIISNLLFQICPIWEGIIYYAVIVLPAFYFGFVTGAFSFWSNKKLAYLIFFFIFLLFAFVPVLEFYIYPQVYFYNVIVGIIPGTIYDEEILIGSKLILYRLFHLSLFSILLYSTFKVRTIKRKPRILLMLSTFIVAIIFFLFKPSLGLSTSQSRLFDNLKKTIVIPSVTIRYANNLTQNQARLLALEHRYYLNEIKRKTKLSTPKGIVSYIFMDRKQKGALFGSKAANVAKPWMNQIFLDYNSVENTLEHELTHIFAAQIGSTPFKIADSFNMAMLEGYAMAIENDYSGYDIHYMALLAKSNGYNFDIPELFARMNFFGQASSLSYITAGSFIKYLIETYGVEKVNSIYQDLNFEKYLGKNLLQLAKEYEQFLEELNYPINKHRANLFFGRRPISKKVCPRTVASDLKSAWDFFKNADYLSARKKFLSIWKYSESYSALLGVIYTNNKIGLFPESLKLLEENINTFERTSSYYSALLNYGDQLAFNENFAKADSVYRLLVKFEPTLRYKNLAEIRRRLIVENKILVYLGGSDFDKYQILKALNTDELFDASIPVMIELSERLDENYHLFFSFFDGKNFENTSSNSAYKISKYLMRNLEFEKSLYFVDLSLEKCTEEFLLPILKSYRKKIEWLNKTVFSD